MTIFKFCNNCQKESEHYTKQIRCIACARESALRSKANRKIGKKYRQELPPNAAQRREYNFMKAPVYTGEKWLDVRGQMKPSVTLITAL